MLRVRAYVIKTHETPYNDTKLKLHQQPDLLTTLIDEDDEEEDIAGINKKESKNNQAQQ